MQKALIADCLDKEETVLSSDEFHASWYLNPLAEVPFFHPKVTKAEDDSYIKIETMSDPIYEKTDSLFDGGFFSNAMHELQCKFNSPQAVLEESAGQKMPFEPPKDFAKQLNEETIAWALENAPARVRRRYEQSGVRLVPGEDITHHSGPSWIWSYLTYKRSQTKDGRNCRKVHSHTMVTPTDHPIPAAGGKMYCKVLSPAKVLDWMYTDSLRPELNPLTLLLSEVFSFRRSSANSQRKEKAGGEVPVN